MNVWDFLFGRKPRDDSDPRPDRERHRKALSVAKETLKEAAAVKRERDMAIVEVQRLERYVRRQR
jgi:hypothetical protein